MIIAQSGKHTKGVFFLINSEVEKTLRSKWFLCELFIKKVFFN